MTSMFWCGINEKGVRMTVIELWAMGKPGGLGRMDITCSVLYINGNITIGCIDWEVHQL